MSGNRIGGLKIKATLIARLGEDGYKKYLQEKGRKGGLAPKTSPSGFAVMDKDRHMQLSSKGGKADRRRKVG